MTHLRSRAAAVLIAVLIGVGALAGCGSDDTSTTAQEPAATTSAGAAPATTQAAAAPATTSGSAATTAAAAEPAATTAPAAQETRAEILLLEGALLDGQQFDLAATAGNDVLLWFWAPW